MIIHYKITGESMAAEVSVERQCAGAAFKAVLDETGSWAEARAAAVPCLEDADVYPVHDATGADVSLPAVQRCGGVIVGTCIGCRDMVGIPATPYPGGGLPEFVVGCVGVD